MSVLEYAVQEVEDGRLFPGPERAAKEGVEEPLVEAEIPAGVIGPKPLMITHHRSTLRYHNRRAPSWSPPVAEWYSALCGPSWTATRPLHSSLIPLRVHCSAEAHCSQRSAPPTVAQNQRNAPPYLL
jgi:hypothetical protein